MNNFEKSIIFGSLIYLLALSLKYFYVGFSRSVFIALLVIGGIFLLPLLAFMIYFLLGLFHSLFGKRSRNKLKKRKK